MKRKIPALGVILLLTTTVTLFFMMVVSRIELVEGLRLKSIDGLFVVRASMSPLSPHIKGVVVVGVDDESFKLMNRVWPWSRDVFAYFMEKLNTHHPKVAAFDFVFVGQDPNPEIDNWWAKTIEESGNVILARYFGVGNTLVLPLAKFADAALAMGLVDKPYGVDGVYRKSRPFTSDETGEYFSLATEALYRSHGTNPADAIHLTDRGAEFFEPGFDPSAPGQPTVAQVDKKKRMWMSYRYKAERFVYTPFWRVLENRINPELFKDKIVLIGPVSPIFHDIHATPLGEMPGVFSIANEIIAMWDKDFVKEPFAGHETLFVSVMGLLFTVLIFRLAFSIQIIVYIAISLLAYATCLTLFCKYGILVEPFSLIVVLTLNFVIVASWKALKTFLDNIALQRQVITDSLTGLYGHRFLTLKLGSVFLHSLQEKTEFCVGMLDADHFKKINDTYGHDVGNEVLVGITKVMKQHVRRQDIAARFGGEEFVLIMIGTDTKGAREGLERMRKAIEELEFVSDKGKFKVTVSGGLVSNQNPAVKNSDDMLKLADKALYIAKEQGRNQVCTI